MDKIKVLLVDDQTLFVESLRTVLETRAQDIAVVGVASNGKIALQLADSEAPDVILMDVRMPEMDGVDCTRAVVKKYPGMKVLMLTTFDDDEYVVKALHLGAVGYLLKDVPPNDLIAAIRTVYQGGIMISPKVVTKLADRLFEIDYENAGRSGAEDGPAWLDELSNREKDILWLLANGHDNKEIAKRLYLAEQTVKNYVSAIYCKMGVRDRVQASRLAVAAGLVRSHSIEG
jgi:DNA-binding NarL/FixJ family response regulator